MNSTAFGHSYPHDSIHESVTEDDAGGHSPMRPVVTTYQPWAPLRQARGQHYGSTNAQGIPPAYPHVAGPGVPQRPVSRVSTMRRAERSLSLLRWGPSQAGIGREYPTSSNHTHAVQPRFSPVALTTVNVLPLGAAEYDAGGSHGAGRPLQGFERNAQEPPHPHSHDGYNLDAAARLSRSPSPSARSDHSTTQLLFSKSMEQNDPSVLKHTDVKHGVAADPDPFLIAYDIQSPLHPFNWPSKKKYLILAVVCAGAACVTAASSISASTEPALQVTFGVSAVVAALGVTLYVIGLGIGALFLGAMSEFFGRSNIYLISFALFVILNVPIATAKNIATILIFRFATGLCASAFLSVAAGTVTDLWKPGTTDLPSAVYTLSPLTGPALGPIIGGFLNQNTPFRNTYFLLIGWGGAQLLLLWLLVPETLLPVILKRAARAKRLETEDSRWYSANERAVRNVSTKLLQASYLPFQMIFKERMILALDLWTALILGIIYLFFNAIPFTFANIYNFSLGLTGLAFIPMLLGMLVGAATQKLYVRVIRDRAILAGGKAAPESRLMVGMAGAVICPIGLLWFSLSSFKGMTFIMPMIGIGIFGCGALYVFISVFGFLVATYPRYAASAMAGNTFVRCAFAAGFPLFANAMYGALGPMTATGVLCAATGAMAWIPFVLFIYGPRLRQSSPYSG